MNKQPDTAGRTPAGKRRDLRTALSACFAPDVQDPPFPSRLVELVSALTNAPAVSVWRRAAKEDEWLILARSGQAELHKEVATEISASLEDIQDKTVVAAKGKILAQIALSSQDLAVLVLTLPTGSATAQGLAFERATLLSHLSFAQFQNPDLVTQNLVFEAVVKVASGDLEAMQEMVDGIAKLTRSEVVSAGLFDGNKITDICIAGQTGFAKRASLPVEARSKLQDVAKRGLVGQEKVFAPVPGGKSGLAIYTDAPVRSKAILPMLASVYANASHAKPKSQWTKQRLVKMGCAGLVIFGLAMVPIPDGVDVPAQIQATTQRILTAPYTGIVAEVMVEDNQPVNQGQIVAQLETREIELELLAVLAEKSSAVLERETARASRNAALLRNAEIEVQRLEARIDLLEGQKDSSVIVSNIDGVTVLGDLKSRLGSTIRQGEPMLTISDSSALELNLQVLETQVGQLEAGDRGVFRPDFDPTRSTEAELMFISPVIDTTGALPSLPATARFVTEPDGLRPGLSGVFVLDDTYRPVWQVVYSNLRDWLLLRFLI